MNTFRFTLLSASLLLESLYSYTSPSKGISVVNVFVVT